MVRTDDDSITTVEDLNGKKVCSVKGSTSAKNLGAKAPQADGARSTRTRSALAAMTDDRVVAVTTDNTILAGLVERSDGPSSSSEHLQRRALRHRREEGRRRVPRLRQRWARRDLRERPMGRGVGSDARSGPGDAGAAGSRPVRVDHVSDALGGSPGDRGPPSTQSHHPGARRVRRRGRGDREPAAVFAGLSHHAGADPHLRGPRTGVGIGPWGFSGFAGSAAAMVRNRLRRVGPQHSTHARVRLLRIRCAAARYHCGFLRLRSLCAVGVHRGVRLRGGALGRQQRRRRPGRGSARGRVDVYPRRCRPSCSPKRCAR